MLARVLKISLFIKFWMNRQYGWTLKYGVIISPIKKMKGLVFEAPFRLQDRSC
jgi:hypothetical protein